MQEAFRKKQLTKGQKILIFLLRVFSLLLILAAVLPGVYLILLFDKLSFWDLICIFAFYTVICMAPIVSIGWIFFIAIILGVYFVWHFELPFENVVGYFVIYVIICFVVKLPNAWIASMLDDL
ncbi:hypothetical protein KVC30_06125 [Helicobacter pylori]|nr:hypothetical protein KVC30_06125 [Helicobacter pylori]WQT59107.1 hypothetical protein E5D95_06110 [Helicobacter pylori]WQT69438.1 hypothetical protein E5D91_06190 [Helicobacter pylori]